jgi:hypothetical protein
MSSALSGVEHSLRADIPGALDQIRHGCGWLRGLQVTLGLHEASRGCRLPQGVRGGLKGL